MPLGSLPIGTIYPVPRTLGGCWRVGNGDLHLKNLALVTDHRGFTRLSPCYDLLSTCLVIPDDALALVAASSLTPDLKATYSNLLTQRASLR